jgi:hypothetical protein
MPLSCANTKFAVVERTPRRRFENGLYQCGTNSAETASPVLAVLGA